jgi:predicted dehydrogenase
MVGHTFVYNPAVRHLKQLLEEGELGTPYYTYAQRLNLGQVRSDVSAWWNLAPHDVSVLLYLFGQQLPEWIAATGVARLQPGIEDVVFAALAWSNGLHANIHVSWLDPGKVRRLTIVGSKKMAVYDDMAEHKLAVVDKGVEAVPRLGERMDYDEPHLRLRAGAVWWPEIAPEEPLKLELIDFIECVESGREPVAAARTGIDVVTVLEAGQRSLKDGGRPVFLAD